MIPVSFKPPPPRFDFRAEVALRGGNSLLVLIGHPKASFSSRRRSRPTPVATRIKDIPSKMLPDHWRRALPALREAYSHICAYLGLRIPPAVGAAEVDHFRPKSKNQHLAYRWENFRLSSKLVNTFKLDYEDVLDPFKIGSDWFSLNLLSGEVEIGPGASSPILREKVQATINRLRLNKNPVFVDARKDYIDRYFGVTNPSDPLSPPPMDLRSLAYEAPFVAAEIVRQGQQRP